MKKRSASWVILFIKAAFLLLVILSVSNCREKVEGCLDIEATNFSFSADEACPDDCCTYPVLDFEIAFRWDTLSMIYNEPYDLLRRVIKITKSKFYISDISLTNSTESLRITDRIELTVNDGSSSVVEFVDDFALLSRDFSSFNYNIGEIRGTGSFDTLRFVVGLSEDANKVEPDLAPEGHPLSIQADSMWSMEDAYVFNKLIIIPDTLPPQDTLEFNISATKVEIALPFNYELEVGNDLTVPLIIDYSKWFEGINFEANPAEVKQNIVENTTKAFSVNE